MRERVKAARHEAYLAAKERRKNDPRTAELKAKVKAARREASARAKERRKNDPKVIALKEKLKQDRRQAREQRKTRTAAAKKGERAKKDGDLRLSTRVHARYLSLTTARPKTRGLRSTSPAGHVWEDFRPQDQRDPSMDAVHGGRRGRTDRKLPNLMRRAA
jgi:hypothetical protein